MARRNRINKARPSANNKIRKLDKDLLSSQFSQSQQIQKQKKHGLQTPLKSNKAPNSLVKPDHTIFSPKKQYEDDDVSEDEYISDNSDIDGDDKDIIEISSSDDEENPIASQTGNPSDESKPSARYTSNRLTSYTVPLNAKTWQPLPSSVASELATLLSLLLPPSLEKESEKYKSVIDREIVAPLSKKFQTVYLPRLHQNASQRIFHNYAGEFNLNTIHQEQIRLVSGYDINSKQLDLLSLQLLKEKEMLDLERKYLRQLKEKVNTWKQNRQKRIDRLKSSLGPEFRSIDESLNAKNSGVDGADDIDMIQDTDNEIVFHDEEKDSGNHNASQAELITLLKEFGNTLDKVDTTNTENREFQIALKQLSNILRMQ